MEMHMMDHVSFTDMSDGTREEYEFLVALEVEYAKKLADRLLAQLRNIANSYSGYMVSRLDHSLQSAT
jgi:predicted HD phosphohydrolase